MDKAEVIKAVDTLLAHISMLHKTPIERHFYKQINHKRPDSYKPPTLKRPVSGMGVTNLMKGYTMSNIQNVLANIAGASPTKKTKGEPKRYIPFSMKEWHDHVDSVMGQTVGPAQAKRLFIGLLAALASGKYELVELATDALKPQAGDDNV